MKVNLKSQTFLTFYPEHEFPFNRIVTVNNLYKITNGEYIGAYGDLYVIEQIDYSSEGECINISMAQSYDSMKIQKHFDSICDNKDVLDLEFF